MKYFLTGATGFIGGYLARQLMEDGHEVIALVRSRPKAKELERLGVKLHDGDITDKESMRAPMDGVDGIFHVAAWYKLGVRHNGQAEKTNVLGTKNVLELMKELAIPKGVYTSTIAVFSDTKGKAVNEDYQYQGPFISEYDRTKWKAHFEVAVPMMKQGLPLVIVQPGLVYGPRDTGPMHIALVRYLQKKLPFIPQKTAYCWQHVKDAAKGHLLAMRQGKTGECYIISGPVHSLIDFFQMAEKICGIKASRFNPSPGIIQTVAKAVELIEKVVPIPPTFSSEALRASGGVTYLGDSSKAKNTLGFVPRPLEEGLRETLAFEMKKLGMKPPG